MGSNARALSAVVSALAGRRDDPSRRLRRGTRQLALIDLLDGHLRSLRILHRQATTGVVQTKAEEALAASDAARPSVVQLAAAIDALDDAIATARQVSGQGEQAVESIVHTVARLRLRRARLFGRLTTAVDEVATVYAGLLELSAIACTMGVAPDDGEVGTLNDAVSVLRMTFTELEEVVAGLGDGATTP